MRVLYVFSQRKLPLLQAWRAGLEPDTLLFGYNHLSSHGVHSTVWEPTYPAPGRWAVRQIGRLGPDAVQMRTLRHLRQMDAALLIAGWPLLLVKRLLRWNRPRMLWLNMTLSTLLRRRSPWQRLLRWSLAGADKIICLANAQVEDIADRLDGNLLQLPVVKSGVDAHFHSPTISTGDQGSFVLAAGRDPGRDYGTLAQAAAKLDVPVRVVTSPSNVAGLNLPSNVELMFDQAPSKLRELYRGAACIAVPTHGDGWNQGSDCSGTLVLLDAMATGRAAVVTERRALKDYILPGREALSVPSGDADALASALSHLLQDRKTAHRLGQAGRAAVDSGLTTEHFAARLVPLLAGETADRGLS